MASKGKSAKANRKRNRPSHKRYNAENRDKKNKELKKKRHEKRLARFKERFHDLTERLKYNKAVKLLARIEDPTCPTDHLFGDLITKAKERVTKHVSGRTRDKVDSGASGTNIQKE